MCVTHNVVPHEKLQHSDIVILANHKRQVGLKDFKLSELFTLDEVRGKYLFGQSIDFRVPRGTEDFWEKKFAEYEFVTFCEPMFHWIPIGDNLKYVIMK